MVQKSLKTIFLFIVTCLLISNLFAQKTIIKTFEGFIIPETGAIFNEKNKKVVCEFIPTAENRPKEYSNVDILAGDLILYVNGNKIKTMKDLKSNYELVKTGDEVKLGIKRQENMFIVSFKKADPKNLPQTNQTSGTGSGQKIITKVMKIESKNGKILMGGKEVNMDSLKKSGKGNIMIINKKDEKK
jgi:hypothetical protein